MMAIRSIVMVTGLPAVVTSPTQQTARQFHRYDAFAGAIRRHSRMDVHVVEDELDTVANDAFVLLDFDAGGDAIRRGQLAVLRRTILVNADRPPTCVDRLEALGLAGTIPGVRYSRWRRDPDHDGGGGLFGLRVVADRMGAGSFGGFDTMRYRDIYSERYRDLPELVAAYIEAFAAMWPDIAGKALSEAKP